jgi:hypothetical protein
MKYKIILLLLLITSVSYAQINPKCAVDWVDKHGAVDIVCVNNGRNTIIRCNAMKDPLCTYIMAMLNKKNNYDNVTKDVLGTVKCEFIKFEKSKHIYLKCPYMMPMRYK